ncbi:MAG: TetR/AcrR family transcriptional regulator [Corynebacteriales bacterium]|nr:TetR/AcrR family transcriptional regulator [Mycobacteriales bacterium]
MNAATAERRLLDTAQALFYAKGIQAVGMDEIREGSGVSLKRLYQLFPSKEELVEETLRRRSAAIQQAMNQYTESVDTPREQILAVFDYLKDWFNAPNFRGCAFINSFGELGGNSAGVAEIVRAHKKELAHTLSSLVTSMGQPSSLGDQLALLANGAMVTAAIVGTDQAAQDAKAAAISLLDNAAQAA